MKEIHLRNITVNHEDQYLQYLRTVDPEGLLNTLKCDLEVGKVPVEENLEKFCSKRLEDREFENLLQYFTQKLKNCDSKEKSACREYAVEMLGSYYRADDETEKGNILRSILISEK